MSQPVQSGLQLPTMSDAPFRNIVGDPAARVLFTCEHASERLPEGWVWPEQDRRLAGTHWASDVGAAALTVELAQALNATAILSNFSRLLVDPNRPLESDTLFRAHAEGAPVVLNAALDAAERQSRIRRFYEPYHAAIDSSLRASSAEFVFAVHSFAPIYEGEQRAVEVGTLFDVQERMAHALNQRLCDAGFEARPNEPWSGKEGLAYSPERHAAAHGRRALEIEVRQDLAVLPEVRARLVSAVVEFLASV